ncbi:hypothetical protein B1A87_002995 [Arthrobacter sp. KBS0703]|nr:hypothetical protein B1A87_002995 [Arthrobacter sp. KBS0703]
MSRAVVGSSTITCEEGAGFDASSAVACDAAADATYTRRNRHRMNETLSAGKGRFLGRVVRGHNGHPLNELADRLAVLGRRNREMGVDEVTNARMIASIREEAKTLVSGVPGPAAA